MVERIVYKVQGAGLTAYNRRQRELQEAWPLARKENILILIFY